MARKKIETKEFLKLVGLADLVMIKKGIGGKVFTEIITKVEKAKNGPKPKDTYVVHSDHNDHSDYSAHSNHGESIHGESMTGKGKVKSKRKPKASKTKRTSKK